MTKNSKICVKQNLITKLQWNKHRNLNGQFFSIHILSKLMVSKIEYYQGKTHRGTEAVSKDKHWGQPDEDGQYNEGRTQSCSHAKDCSVTVGALKINRQKFFQVKNG